MKMNDHELRWIIMCDDLFGIEGLNVIEGFLIFMAHIMLCGGYV